MSGETGDKMLDLLMVVQSNQSSKERGTARSNSMRRDTLLSLFYWAVAISWCGAGELADPLPSWNAGAAREAILQLVARTTAEGSKDFVPVGERIATFDNDGTLWCEQPMYVQAAFIIDRVKLLAKEHPEWKTEEPFKSVLAGNLQVPIQKGETAIAQLLGATHANMTVAEFEKTVTDWLATARHPRFHRPYNELVYQPMLEVLAYLRANQFKTFIVSGGGIEFMRPWAPAAYGIPPEQIVGSSIRTRFELRDGVPAIWRLPEINFIDDGPGKPVGINQFIGRRPVCAFGNSDGDYQMLQWTTMNRGARLGMYVHHDDPDREYAYDRKSPVGRLAKGLDDADKYGWIIISMKHDWKVVFPE